jgi:hypothetical protein
MIITKNTQKKCKQHHNKQQDHDEQQAHEIKFMTTKSQKNEEIMCKRKNVKKCT